MERRKSVGQVAGASALNVDAASLPDVDRHPAFGVLLGGEDPSQAHVRSLDNFCTHAGPL